MLVHFLHSVLTIVIGTVYFSCFNIYPTMVPVSRRSKSATRMYPYHASVVAVLGDSQVKYLHTQFQASCRQLPSIIVSRSGGCKRSTYYHPASGTSCSALKLTTFPLQMYLRSASGTSTSYSTASRAWRSSSWSVHMRYPRFVIRHLSLSNSLHERIQR